MPRSIYLIGALKNRTIQDLAIKLRKEGHDVFDDWQAPGPEADSYLLEWATKRGLNYKEALNTYAAKHVFEFDKFHVDRCTTGIMVMPAGKSGHLELGYMAGQGKDTFILFDNWPDRFDVMYQFATDVFADEGELIARLKEGA